MVRSTKPGRLHISFSPVTSTVALATWRWRQHWFLLLMTGLGIVAFIFAPWRIRPFHPTIIVEEKCIFAVEE